MSDWAIEAYAVVWLLVGAGAAAAGMLAFRQARRTFDECAEHLDDARKLHDKVGRMLRGEESPDAEV